MGSPMRSSLLIGLLLIALPALAVAISDEWELRRESDGIRVLTDPVWSRRVSPSRLVGPKRFQPVPVPISQLPPLDAVIISHDHYDHLDYPSIVELIRCDVPFYTSLGVGAHLEAWGVPPERIIELDWWESADLPNANLRITSAPSQHFSGRAAADRNRTLWSSFALRGPQHGVFFSGDTGMFPGFAEIGERYGPFDVTMLEVGAYNAMWADVHLGPEQALEAHRMLRGELMLPIHWGTFNLALHGWTEPAERLLVAAQRAGVAVALPRPGGRVEPATPPALVRWWPEIPWQTAAEHPVISSGPSPGTGR